MWTRASLVGVSMRRAVLVRLLAVGTLAALGCGDGPRDWGLGNGFFSGQMRIAFADGTIHVGWTLFDLVYGGAEIAYSRSTDRGSSFTPPLIVSTIDEFNSYVPWIAATGGETVSLVWANVSFLAGG